MVNEKEALRRKRIKQLGLVVVIAIMVVFLMPRITQSQSYHTFTDDVARRIAREDFEAGEELILNFSLGNVLSNAAFLIIGIWGLITLWKQYRKPTAFASRSEMWPYVIFFVGICLTAFGSAYYHHNPNDETLVWDRLPMTISFMSLLTILLAERVSLRLSRILFIPLLAIGIYSVISWAIENYFFGNGDLRLYVLVQFLPLVLILLIGRWFPSRYTHGSYIYLLFGFYAFAKLLEVLDTEVFLLSHLLSPWLISGHEAKHIIAAIGTYVLIPTLKKRTVKRVDEQLEADLSTEVVVE
ncbi:alkaline phytoceramidase [Candidatus Leptofilum sp.]|uniref:alkaline phytoceramidase n=1 Tax=Candidatus Leptofilum sp. TaxID=3241576 RepID=UPI003B5CFB57